MPPRLSLRILVPIFIVTAAAPGVAGAAPATLPAAPLFKVIHSFSGTSYDGAQPLSGLTLGSDGNFYGTTSQGGQESSSCPWSACGTIFRMSPQGRVTVLHSFTGGLDGADPRATLLEGVIGDGYFYGSTAYGGTTGNPSDAFGVLYKISPSGQFFTLHAFKGVPDGSFPTGAVVQTPDGTLYGTTQGGGAYGYGTVFKLSPNGSYAILHSFKNDGADGLYPYAGLTFGADGNLYGMTNGGGSGYNCGPNGCGTAFRITPTGDLAILHSFSGYPDGGEPEGALLLARDGNFFGTTSFGGAQARGTIFRMTPAGEITVIHAFGAVGDAAVPTTGPIQARDGTLYGITGRGGSYDEGAIYSISPNATESVLYSFTDRADGALPYGGIVFGAHGALYGTTEEGGVSFYGTAFKYLPGRP